MHVTTVIQRIYRVAVSHGVFAEAAPDTYAHNNLSRTLNLKGLGLVFMIVLEFGLAFIHLLDYLKSHKPEDVFDLVKSLAVYFVGKEYLSKSYYELLEMDPDPERCELWNAYVVAVDQLMPVVGMFPFASLMEEVKQDRHRPFLVDIVPGRGQPCIAIRKGIGDAFDARYILQDLPGVIDTMNSKVYPGFELMTYHAFTPQPVKSTYSDETDSCLDQIRRSESFLLSERNRESSSRTQTPAFVSSAVSSTTSMPQSVSNSLTTPHLPWVLTCALLFAIS
jgi:hypothetical protein